MRTLLAAAVLALTFQTQPALTPFLGAWNITGTGDNTDVVYWLDVSEADGVLKGRFLNRWSSPYDLPHIEFSNGELSFWNNPPDGQTQPPAVWRAKVVDGKLVGTTTSAPDRDGRTPAVINWVGVRPPAWPASNANGAHVYGEPVALFDGTSMIAWGVQHKDEPAGWAVVDGAMTNAVSDHGANNLVSKESFKDFKIEAEYKLDKDSNSGIYLRGRYELQVLDDAGQPITPHGHMAIYGRTPVAVNASLPAGEWQKMEAIIVGNRVTVVLNGQKVHDNAVIEGITGGALDADELEAGPIMLQGDHSKVWFRRVIVTPITRAGM